MTVKPAWSEQGRIQDVGPVSRSHDNYLLMRLKPVHFTQKLIKRLLPLIVASSKTGPPGAAHCIDLIYENNTRLCLPCLFEHIPDAGGANTHKHFDKFRGADAVKRNTGLTCGCARQQSFSCSRIACQQNPLR